MVAERRRIADAYRSALRDVLGAAAVLQEEPEWARSNWQSICVRLSDGGVPASVMAALERVGIASRAGIPNAHEPPLLPAGERRLTLAESERATRETVMLPIFAGMTVDDVGYVAEALKSALVRP